MVQSNIMYHAFIVMIVDLPLRILFLAHSGTVLTHRVIKLASISMYMRTFSACLQSPACMQRATIVGHTHGGHQQGSSEAHHSLRAREVLGTVHHGSRYMAF